VVPVILNTGGTGITGFSWLTSFFERRGIDAADAVRPVDEIVGDKLVGKSRAVAHGLNQLDRRGQLFLW
jgi:hypothetical protein